MQLLARNAQLARINGRKIGAAGSLGLTHKALDRLGRTIQRLSELVKHPSQRAKIIDGKIEFSSS
ncbi:hypothetical protein LP414_20970 [Polaromonas sp. P1(28)-13]|nr:hypothetical protein LP414_20970 [Polaromonas sp. P1(28)-13]